MDRDKLNDLEIEALFNNPQINMDWEVKFYIDLMRIIKTDKKITAVTRLAYEKYYGMKCAGLSRGWLERYFNTANTYLEKAEQPSSFAELMAELGPDNNRVQFSFTTKLYHTLKEDEPIYDSNVRTFLELRTL